MKLQYLTIVLITSSALLYSCQTSSLTATQTIQLGDQLNNQNKYPEAIEQYKSYLLIAPTLGVYRNYELESEVHRKLAHAYSTQGQYQKSLDHLQIALKIDQDINKNQLNVIEDLRQLGTVSTYLGQYETAIRFLSQSLNQTQGMENSVKDSRRLITADTQLSLAHVQNAVGNSDSTRLYTENALIIYKSIPNEHVGLIEANLILGNLHINRNEIETGLEYILQSSEIAVSNDLNTVRQLQSQGEAYKLIGELENSLRANLESLEEARETQILPQIVWATIRVGDAYLKLGDVDKANQYYLEGLKLQSENRIDTSSLFPSIQMRMGEIEQARSFWAASGSKIGSAIANLKLGESNLAEGKVEASSPYFIKAVELFEEVGVVEGLAKANLGLSHGLIENGNFKEALGVLNTSLELSMQEDIHWQIWFQKGVAFETGNLPDSAANAYLKSIEIIERLRGSLTINEFRSTYFQNKTIVYDHLINLLFQEGEQLNILNKGQSSGQMAFMLNERARSRTFLDLIGNEKIKTKSSDDDLLLNEEQSLRLKIQRLSHQIQQNSLNGQSPREIISKLDRAQDEYTNILEELKLRNSAYQSMVSIQPPDLKQIQATLDTKTALIEFWLGEKGVHAWLITKDEIKSYQLSASKIEITKNISALRNAIQFQMQDNIQSLLKHLNHQLIEPLEDQIAKFDNLGIIPHGALHFLPFQALMDQHGNYLIAQNNLFYSPSSSIYYYTHIKDEPITKSVLSLALGDHAIGSHNALPGTAFEVNQIAQFYDQYTPRFRENNSESYFKTNANQHSVIHIATHGILSDQQPLYSYLLMSPSSEDDGRLTVHEIMDLNLNAKLVTLSACETALGDLNSGDELVGLSRAFLYAGTSAVIVSLWTVDDVSTSILMTKFHQFLNEGNRPAIALSMAQREMLKSEFQLSDGRGRELEWDDSIRKVLDSKNEYSQSPYYWAPFVLIGDIF